MTLDCSGLQNGQSRVISFLKRRYGGQLGPLFCCLGSVYSSREISGMVTRQNRLERKTLLEGNSVLPP